MFDLNFFCYCSSIPAARSEELLNPVLPARYAQKCSTSAGQRGRRYRRVWVLVRAARQDGENEALCFVTQHGKRSCSGLSTPGSRGQTGSELAQGKALKKVFRAH